MRHDAYELHPAEWAMLAEQRAFIDLIRAIVGTPVRETAVCQHGHVIAEMYEPDMRFVPVYLN